jgi:hypothetical protein
MLEDHKDMKKFLLAIILFPTIFLSSIASADQIDDDNAETAAVVRDIKENGPPELRSLPASAIGLAAGAFVIGRRMGTISPATLSRLGGVKGATIHSLQGQLKALGYR